MKSSEWPLSNTGIRYGFPLGLDLCAVVLALALHDGLAAYQASARFTGRVSLVIFAGLALLYAAPARRELARKLMAPFAAVHFFHLACLISYLQQLGEWPAPARLLGGGLAYVLILGMPLFQAFSTGLGARLRLLVESFYLGWAAFIFFMSYVLRLAGKVPGAGGTRAEHIGLLCLVVAALVGHLVMRSTSPARRA